MSAVSDRNYIREGWTASIKEIPEDARCGCSGCVELCEASRVDSQQQGSYAKVQWASMFAKKLLKPTISDETFRTWYACDPVRDIVQSIFDFVSSGNSGVCTEVNKVLSDLCKQQGGMSSLTLPRNYVAYDASAAVCRLTEAYSKTGLDVTDRVNCSVLPDVNLVWVYIPSADFVSRGVEDLLVNIGPRLFKRFEVQKSFDAVRIVARSIKITRDVDEVPKSLTSFSGSTPTRYRALPVIADESDDKAATVSAWAKAVFHGQADLAALAYVSQSHAIQKLINLVDVRLDLSKCGFSGIKAVAAVASIAKSDPSNLFLTWALLALKDYVGGNENLTTEEMFDRCLEGRTKGKLVSYLSNRTTLSCFSSWMKNCNDVSPKKAYRLDHHMFLWTLRSVNKPCVMGYGPVTVGSETYSGGRLERLQDRLKWDEFNELVIRPVTGYVLSDQWSNWEEFLGCRDVNVVWAFVGAKNEEGQQGLTALQQVASTSFDDILDCVGRLARRRKHF